MCTDFLQTFIRDVLYPDKSKKVYHADYNYYTYYDYYTIPIGIAQLNTFSCAKNRSTGLQLIGKLYQTILT